MLNIRALNQQFGWVNPARFWNAKLDTLVITVSCSTSLPLESTLVSV